MLSFLIISVSVVVTQAMPAPGHGVLTGYCITSSDCAPGECCESLIQPKGKRSTQPVLPFLSADLLKYVSGVCKKRFNESDTCIIPGMHPPTEGLYYDCPCAEGLYCASTGQQALYKGEFGVCEHPPAPSKKRASSVGHPCGSGADCAADECCISSVRPIGRRRRQLHGAGHCQPMGTTGSGCLVRYSSGKPADMVFECPCSTGLQCHGSGMFDIPLGELGKCGA